jgi:hypothetical protein
VSVAQRIQNFKFNLFLSIESGSAWKKGATKLVLFISPPTYYCDEWNSFVKPVSGVGKKTANQKKKKKIENSEQSVPNNAMFK